jgi:hypothetical protein
MRRERIRITTQRSFAGHDLHQHVSPYGPNQSQGSESLKYYGNFALFVSIVRQFVCLHIFIYYFYLFMLQFTKQP